MTDEKIEELAAHETPAEETADAVAEIAAAEDVVDQDAVAEPTEEPVAAEVEMDDADLATDEEIAASATEQDEHDDADDEATEHHRGRGRLVKRVGNEVRRLMDYSTKYPEIGPTVADLAFKLGYSDVGNRILRMGLESEDRDIEYYFVSAEAARRDGRFDDSLNAVLEGIKAAIANLGDSAPNGRVLHLVRVGFAVLMFEINDVHARPEFMTTVVEALKSFEPHFAQDPFFYTLLAQALWSTDREASEAAWEQAVSFGEKETTWNARGTWYKEAEKHLGRSEEAYRRGLKDAPASALLMHNLAQVLMDRAAAPDAEVGKALEWSRQADRLMRKAMRATTNPRLRRHIRENIERVQKFQVMLPAAAEAKAEKEPEVGDIVHGRVRSIQVYGAFLSIPGGHSGLLHKTEIGYERIDHPNQVLKVGDSLEVKIIEVKQEDGGLRIGFSRKAVLPAPPEGTEPAPRERAPRQERQGDRPQGDRPQGDRNRPQGDRNRPQAARPQGDRPQGDRPQGDRPQGDRNRPQGDRPQGDRPQGDRNRDDRNRGDRNKGGDNRAPREYRDPTPSSDDKFGKLGDLLLAKLNLTRDDK